MWFWGCASGSESCLTFGIGRRFPHFPMKVFAAIAALLLVAYVTGRHCNPFVYLDANKAERRL